MTDPNPPNSVLLYVLRRSSTSYYITLRATNLSGHPLRQEHNRPGIALRRHEAKLHFLTLRAIHIEK